MQTKLAFLLTLLLSSCSTSKVQKISPNHRMLEEATPKDFSAAEVIQASMLLTKIYDKEILPLACIPDTEEADLLQRTLGPRFELAQDDFEASLDQTTEVDKLIDKCELNCSCHYVDDLVREHQVSLSKQSRKMLNEKKTSKELKRCLMEIQTKFCESELFQSLQQEKVNFSFEQEDL